MAIKTRTPRTSSGANKERKAERRLAQQERKEVNLQTIGEHKGQPYFSTVNLTDSKGRGKRPSKIRRAAERARRRHEQAQQKSED